VLLHKQPAHIFSHKKESGQARLDFMNA